MTRTGKVSRRGALKLGAAAAALPLVHIRTAGAAGKLAIGFWDHWVPAGNDVMQKQVDAWAEKNKVEVTADFITGNGNKLLITGAAEAQAKTGHDMLHILQLGRAQPSAELLSRVDDVMKQLIGKNGAVERDLRSISPSRRATGWRCRPVPARRPSRPARGSAGSRSTASTCRRCIR